MSPAPKTSALLDDSLAGVIGSDALFGFVALRARVNDYGPWDALGNGGFAVARDPRSRNALVIGADTGLTWGGGVLGRGGHRVGVGCLDASLGFTRLRGLDLRGGDGCGLCGGVLLCDLLDLLGTGDTDLHPGSGVQVLEPDFEMLAVRLGSRDACPSFLSVDQMHLALHAHALVKEHFGGADDNGGQKEEKK